MIRKEMAIILMVLGALVLPAAAAAAADQTPAGPIAAFVTTRHEFKPVIEGNTVLYDFVVRNTGSGVLKIKDVRTG